MELNGNLKGLRGPIRISPRTLIAGPTGSGKSRIAEALRFALTGEIPLLGRDSVKGGAILRSLLPPGENVLWATVTAGDGTIYGARLDARAKSAKLTLQRPGSDATVREAAEQTPFIVTEVRDALTASPENALRWIGSVVGIDTKASIAELIARLRKENPTDTLPLDYLAAWTEGGATVDDAIEAGTNAVEQFTAAVEVARAEVSRVGGASVVPSADDLQKAEDAAKLAHASVAQWRTHDENAAAFYTKLQRYYELRTIVGAVGSENVVASEVREHWNYVALIMARFKGTCDVCGGHGDVHAIHARAKSVTDWVDAADAHAIKADAAAEAARELGTITQELATLQSTLDPSRMQQISAGAYKPIAPDAEAHAKRVDDYREVVQRAIVSSQAPTIAARELHAAESRLSAANVALTELKNHLRTEAAASLDAFERHVQLYLPRSWDSFRIQLKPNVAMMLRGQDGYDRVPSDGQEAVLLVAVALAIANRPVIAILPDRQIDAATFRDVIDTLGSVQLPPRATLVAMTTLPFMPNDVVPGWSIIDATTNEAGVAAAPGAALPPPAVGAKRAEAADPSAEPKKRGRKPKAEATQREPTTPENDGVLASALAFVASVPHPPVMLSEIIRACGDAGVRDAGKVIAKRCSLWEDDGWLLGSLIELDGVKASVFTLTDKGREWYAVHVPPPGQGPAPGEAF
jgi:energy-coupling factor transporter ATP-binding protein EcfA2